MRWVNFAKSPMCEDKKVNLRSLLRKVEEDNRDGWERLLRQMIFNQHISECWESHNRWYDHYMHLELDDLGKELLWFKCSMYLYKTLACTNQRDALVLQRRRNDEDEVSIQSCTLAQFQTRYRKDRVYFSPVEPDSEDTDSEEEGGEKKPKKGKKTCYFDLIAIFLQQVQKMRWSSRKSIPYNVRFPWVAGEYEFNSFCYYKAQKPAERMYMSGVVPCMRFVAKILWHIRHVWASVPLDHYATCKDDRSCQQESCVHFRFLRDHFVYMIQHPSTKTGVGIILRSEIPGAGKSKIFYWFWLSLLGKMYGEILTKAHALTTNFNARSEGCKMSCGDDIGSIRGNLATEILGRITQEEVRVEQKGSDAYYSPDHQEVFLLTNAEDPPVPVKSHDRRWFIIGISCAFAHKQNGGLVSVLDDDGEETEKVRMTPAEYWSDFIDNYLTDESAVHFFLWCLLQPEVQYDRQHIPETEWSKDVKADYMPQYVAFAEHLLNEHEVVNEKGDRHWEGLDKPLKLTVYCKHQEWMKQFKKEDLETYGYKPRTTANAFGKMMASLWGKKTDGPNYGWTGQELHNMIEAKKSFSK